MIARSSGKWMLLSVALAAGFAPAEALPFRDLAQVESSFATNTPAMRCAAFNWLQSVVRTNESESAVRRQLWVLRGMAQGLSRGADYERTCRDLLASPAESVRHAAMLGYRNSPLLLSEAERIAGDMAEILSTSGRDFLLPEHRFSALSWLSDLMAVRLMDSERALALLGNYAATESGLSLRVRALVRRAEILRDARRTDDAVAEARGVLALTNCPPETFVSASFVLAPLLAARGDRTAAENVLFGANARQPGATGLAGKFAAIGSPTQTLDRAVGAIRSGLLALPLDDADGFRAAVIRALPELVDLLWQTGRMDEAVAECRAALMVSSARTYPQVVELAATAMRRRDIHLGCASAFLDFNDGNSVPTGRNPILDAPHLDDPARRAARARLDGLESSDWTVRLAIARRLLWMDDPVASVDAAMAAFARAPLESRTLQACADVILHPLIVATRNPAVVAQGIDFLKFGPAGADGVPGTADDVVSPSEVAREVFR